MTYLPETPPGLADFLDGHTSGLIEAVGPNLIASLVHGSVALGSFVPFRSDLDMLVVVAESLDVAAKSRLVRHLWALSTPEAIRGVETRVVTMDQIGHPKWTSGTELLVSTHPGEPHTVDNPMDDQLFIELDVAAQHSISVHGPPAQSLIGPIDRVSVLRWMLQRRTTNLRAAADGPEFYVVLSTARCLLYMDSGTHAGKIPAAEWAIDHGYPREVLSHAISVQRGDARERPWTAEGRQFVESVIGLLEDEISAASG